MKIFILLLLLLSFINIKCGPITAYTACTACCASIHWYDWFVPIFGASTTGLCIIEACLNPIPGPCIDPRDNSCMFIFLGTLILPSP